ncbi:hypothetical protein GCM10028784_28920 [Myceligenerans cantabricum]
MTPAAERHELSTPSVELASWVRTMRDSSGKSLAELGTDMGFAPQTISEASSPKRVVSPAVLKALATAVGEDPDEWLRYRARMKKLIAEGDRSRPRAQLAPQWHPWYTELHQPSEPDRSADESVAEPPPPAADDVPPSTRRRLGRAGGVLAVAVAAGATAWATVTQPWDGPTEPETFPEQAFVKAGVPTHLDPWELDEPGTKIPFRTVVEVECKLFAPSAPSISPDGYWYLIRTEPWDGYYSAANTFLNGDPEEGPYTRMTDLGVPDCPEA